MKVIVSRPELANLIGKIQSVFFSDNPEKAIEIQISLPQPFWAQLKLFAMESKKSSVYEKFGTKNLQQVAKYKLNAIRSVRAYNR